MPHDDAGSTGLATTNSDYSGHYYETYDHADVGPYDWATPHWRNFFISVADRIVGLVQPRTVLDVGCAKGLLVQALVHRGVDATGVDISEEAVRSAHDDVRDRLQARPATEPFEGRYDLITCTEVLEHMSSDDAQLAIDNMCAATDRILFSSCPTDFTEPTHVNSNPTSRWAAWFAERGFYRNTELDAGFLASWAVVFERAEVSERSLVHRYETFLAPLVEEVAEKRRALLDATRELNDWREEAASNADPGRTIRGQVELTDKSIQERHADLVAKDHVIGLEARTTALDLEIRIVRRRNQRMRDRIEDLEEELAALRGSRTWRVGRAVVGPMGRLRR